MQVEDVPKLWNEKMKVCGCPCLDARNCREAGVASRRGVPSRMWLQEYLGDVPPTDALGCLQVGFLKVFRD